MSTVQINDVEPRVQYVIGSTADAGPFSVPFPFFAKADVVVTTTDGSTVTELVLDSDYTLSGTSVDDGFQNGEVTLTPALSDVTLTIYRRIKIERTADFPQQGPFNIPALNTVIDKLFAIAQEHDLRLERAITLSYEDIRADIELPPADEGKPVIWQGGNLTTAARTHDSYVSESKNWANYPVDSLVPEGDGADDYSALHHATKASESETAAASSEVKAAASETAAETSETNAAASETAAAASETNAASSASAAATSETNAAASESAAAASEANAATSATNAATSETNAASSASAAATSETNAAASATAAGTSETNAAGHEAKAQDWAEHPEDTQVETGAYSALHHAAKASASETAAATSESNAATSATNAATSENNAATSETNAATSETNAGASEAKAQDWATEAENVEVETGLYSAFHWAQKAANHAQTAQDGIPAGVIVMWSGAITAVPPGWALCDGANGTPDLRDRFVVGAGSTYAVDDTGGSLTTDGHALTEEEMPSHTHGASFTPSGGGGTFQATTSVGVDAQPSDGSFLAAGSDVQDNDVKMYRTTAPPITRVNLSGLNVTIDGDVTVQPTGSDTSHSHTYRPPYFALAYIMKI